ncbi:MAG: AAA family ATPase, partial [Deltaproteobacteria bacterium]|nr:AAA family ATPase [Deltaproteobacteria bacterium]
MSPWDGRKVVVCVGTGGVGKTTTAAALAIAAAAAGRRTLVMTIDPARRLANAMGIAEIGNLEREIPSERLAAYGVQLKAPLFAMMPDVKRTFDDLVRRTAPNPEARDRILNSRIYEYFSTSLVGSHEYAAVEKLYEVYASGAYDLIVLDTPP